MRYTCRARLIDRELEGDVGHGFKPLLCGPSLEAALLGVFAIRPEATVLVVATLEPITYHLSLESAAHA